MAGSRFRSLRGTAPSSLIAAERSATAATGADLSERCHAERTLFGAERVGEGELFLVRDPLDVLKAYENGIENVVAFLTDGISSAQLQYLSALMDEKHIDVLTFL